MPPLDLIFECDDTTLYSSYRVKKSEDIEMGDSLIVFSPMLVSGKGRQVVTWSLPWNTPYRATNFLYLTTPSYRYVVVRDDPDTGKAEKVYNDLPDMITKSFKNTLAEVDDKNNRKVRIITFSGSTINVPPALHSMDDKDVTLVKIQPVEGGVEGWGTATFYEKNGTMFGETGETKYLGEASMYGAIYSDSINNYECNMGKGYKRLKLLTEVYKERTSGLETYYSNNADPQNCVGKLQTANGILSNIISMTNVRQAESHYAQMVQLEDENKNIQRYSCPVVY